MTQESIIKKFALPDLLGEPLLYHLDEAINYNVNDTKIIDRFLKTYSLDKKIASKFLKAVKAHLWLSQKHQREEGKIVPIFYDAYAIDEMWHTLSFSQKNIMNFHIIFLELIYITTLVLIQKKMRFL